MNWSDRFKHKTTWLGILSIAAGVIEGIFDGDWAKGSEKILFGLALITGREAIAKAENAAKGKQ